MSETEGVVIRVKSTREPGYAKRVAGAMGWRLREDGFCKVRAVKMDAVNTALKAVAIINERVSGAGLKFAIDLCLQTVGPDEKGSTVIAMTVQDAGECPRPTEFAAYKVSGKQEAEKDLVSRLAGAVAAKVREGHGVSMRCIGPAAVYRAVLAATIAKGYIYSNGLSAVISPRWDTLDQGGKSVSVLLIDFWGKPA